MSTIQLPIDPDELADVRHPVVEAIITVRVKHKAFKDIRERLTSDDSSWYWVSCQVDGADDLLTIRRK